MFPFNPAALCGIMIAQSAIQTDIIGLSGFTGIIPASQTSITVCAPHPKNKQKGITFYVGL